MESASVVFSKCEKALSGTALLMAELVAPAEFAPLFDVEDVLGESAFAGGASVFADGGYCAAVGSPLDPAGDDPEVAKEEEAPVPVGPPLAMGWTECRDGSVCWDQAETAADSREQHGTDSPAYTSC